MLRSQLSFQDPVDPFRQAEQQPRQPVRAIA